MHKRNSPGCPCRVDCTLHAATDGYANWETDAGDPADWEVDGDGNLVLSATGLRLLDPTAHPNDSGPWPMRITGQIYGPDGATPRLVLAWAADGSSGLIVQFELGTDYGRVRVYTWDGSTETEVGNAPATVDLLAETWVTVAACYDGEAVTVTVAGVSWTMPATMAGGPRFGVGSGAGSTAVSFRQLAVSAIGETDLAYPGTVQCPDCTRSCPLWATPFGAEGDPLDESVTIVSGTWVNSSSGLTMSAGSGEISHRTEQREFPVQQTLSLLGSTWTTWTLKESTGKRLTVTLENAGASYRLKFTYPTTTYTPVYSPWVAAAPSLVTLTVCRYAARFYVTVASSTNATWVGTNLDATSATATFITWNLAGAGSTDLGIIWTASRHKSVDEDCPGCLACTACNSDSRPDDVVILDFGPAGFLSTHDDDCVWCLSFGGEYPITFYDQNLFACRWLYVETICECDLDDRWWTEVSPEPSTTIRYICGPGTDTFWARYNWQPTILIWAWIVTGSTGPYWLVVVESVDPLYKGTDPVSKSFTASYTSAEFSWDECGEERELTLQTASATGACAGTWPTTITIRPT